MYNKDDLLDSYFMANDYKETDIETATKNINVFIEKYGFNDVKIIPRDIMAYVYKNHDFLRLKNVNEEEPLVLGLNNEIESTVAYLNAFSDQSFDEDKKIK
ncbi:unknown [Clostridium sp. CAG:594]|nr:unknown [Clostridium sp. CAG:594]